MAEGDPADEESDARQNGIEEIESSHRSNAHEVEERPLDTQISERLMQALKDAICALLLLFVVWQIPRRTT